MKDPAFYVSFCERVKATRNQEAIIRNAPVSKQFMLNLWQKPGFAEHQRVIQKEAWTADNSADSWIGSIATNAPPCLGDYRGFESRPIRHLQHRLDCINPTIPNCRAVRAGSGKKVAVELWVKNRKQDRQAKVDVYEAS